MSKDFIIAFTFLMFPIGYGLVLLGDALIFRIKFAVKIHKAKKAARKFFKIYNKMMDRSGMPRITKEQKEIIINNFIAIHTGIVPVVNDLKDYFNIR